MQFRGRSQLTDWLAVGRNGDPAWWPKVTIVAAMHQPNRGSLFGEPHRSAEILQQLHQPPVSGEFRFNSQMELSRSLYSGPLAGDSRQFLSLKPEGESLIDSL